MAVPIAGVLAARQRQILGTRGRVAKAKISCREVFSMIELTSFYPLGLEGKMFFRTAALIVAVAVSGTSAVSYSQNSPAQTAELKKDEAELKTFTLTMDIVNRTVVSVGAMRDAVKSGPALQKSLKDKNDANQQEDEQPTISQMASVYSSSPKITAIVAAHGFTPRKFALSQMSIIQTSLALAALQAGASMSDVVSKGGVNPENIKLFRDHKDELQELFKKYPLTDPE